MTNCCRRILSVCFSIFVVRNLSYCFDPLRLVRLVASSCCILNLISVLSWFHTLTCILRQSVRLVGLVVLFSFRSRNFRCGRWVWLILSGELILKCDFCMYFCLIRLFYGWYDWLFRSYLYYIVFSVGVWGALMYSKLVTISTISCVGRTVIYLSIIYF